MPEVTLNLHKTIPVIDTSGSEILRKGDTSSCSTPSRLPESSPKDAKAGRSLFHDAVVEEHHFVVNRSLDQYIHVFGKPFADDLRALDSNSKLLDLGCGNGRFLANYLSSKGDYRGHLGCKEAWPDAKEISNRDILTKARVTGVSYKSDYEQFLGDLPQDRWNMQVGRYWEEIPDKELEQYDLIVDNFGVLLYTHHFAIALDKALRRLTDEGALYLYEGDSGEFFYSRVTTLAGEDISLEEWLLRVPGIGVEQLETKPGEFGNKKSYRITIEDRDAIDVQPLLLDHEDFFAQTPNPKRFFREQKVVDPDLVGTSGAARVLGGALFPAHR